jgi:hypothetical protein
MIEDETTYDSGELEPQLTWTESLGDDTGMMYVLSDKARPDDGKLWGFIVEYKTGFIHILGDEVTEEQSLFHHLVDVKAAQNAVELAYLASLASSTSRDASLGADDEQLVHQG